jgi:AraC-like DNA-binding protein
MAAAPGVEFLNNLRPSPPPAANAVTGVALEVGYQSPSAFIAAFTDAFGTTPGRYH